MICNKKREEVIYFAEGKRKENFNYIFTLYLLLHLNHPK